jgi:outer membrane receptor protein involved in Fe transport
MQPFQFLDIRMMFDVCYFHQDYKNFIEFSMGPWGASKVLIERYGYKFLNIGPAKVNGVDFSLTAEGKMTKHISYTLMASYTWSNPTTKDTALIYYKFKPEPDSPETDCSFNSTSSDTARRVLKYRIEHMIKLDLDFTFFKKFALGGTLNYYTSMKNVDVFMFEKDANNPNFGEEDKQRILSIGDFPFYNFYNFFQDHKKGSLTLDLRASYYFPKVSISFIVKNVTNSLYALRPLYVEPPRTFTLQLVVKI